MHELIQKILISKEARNPETAEVIISTENNFESWE
jgi:hypothetical protein